MTVLINDPLLEHRLIAERRASGADRFDEVWDGVYVMAPLANNSHQAIQAGFVVALRTALGFDSPAIICPGVNISDRADDWTQNYRCPDVVAFLPGNRAEDRDTHWLGGPDFLIEIASESDRAWDKLPFYAAVGVREVLIVDRNPWAIELYQASGNPPALQLKGRETIATGGMLASATLPLTFRLVDGADRPKIETLSTVNPSARWMI